MLFLCMQHLAWANFLTTESFQRMTTQVFQDVEEIDEIFCEKSPCSISFFFVNNQTWHKSSCLEQLLMVGQPDWLESVLCLAFNQWRFWFTGRSWANSRQCKNLFKTHWLKRRRILLLPSVCVHQCASNKAPACLFTTGETLTLICKHLKTSILAWLNSWGLIIETLWGAKRSQ